MVAGACAGFWVTTVVGVTGATGATVVVVTATVVDVAGTVVLVVDVVTGLSSFLRAGGMIAGLLGWLVTTPRIDTIQQRDPDAGVTSSVVRRL